ncbi:HAD hydrolase family protein [Casaltella massiliensis]|nr:HAD hydrolase family protein [Casaltella massiliensis]
MLTYAGTSFAMLNARDEVKAVADDVIGHHADAAVMTYLENLVK